MEKWTAESRPNSRGQAFAVDQPTSAVCFKSVKTLAVEVPLHYSITGVGSYAGSSDGLMLVHRDVVLIDYKTKCHGKYVSPRFYEQ